MAESQSLSLLERNESQTNEIANSPLRQAIENLPKEVSQNVSNSEIDEFNFLFPPIELTQNKTQFKNYSKTLQSWIGHVVEIKDDVFIAELIDKTNGGTKEIAEFEMDSVSPSDIPLLKLGSSFYWSISKKNLNGQIINESFIRFQRVINWTFDDIDRVNEKTNNFLNNIKFE